MKNILKILLLLAVTGYLVFAVIEFAKPTEDYICEALDIEIDNEGGMDFVSPEYIMNILGKNKILTEGQKLSQINISDIEQLLTEDPYIENASCYCTAANHISICVRTEQPILHVILHNEDYYLDTNGAIMPIDTFNLDLCIATGNITREFAMDHLTVLARFIQKDKFWNEQIEQIHVTDENNIELYPKKGEYNIIIGSTEDLADKFERLMLFYEKGLPNVGWNQYKSINVSYKGQVVCTKRDNK